MFKKLIFLLLVVGFAYAEPLLLDGDSLTINDIASVARHGQEVTIVPEAQDRVERSHQLLLQGAKQGLPIYGLNRGVGLNKDKQIFQGDAIDPEVLKISRQFNKNLIYSHSAGVSNEIPEEIVRAAMLVRLNGLLKGVAGIQPRATVLLAEMLNRGIHPVMPTKGSLGEADIAILSHVGLAMMGEGEVWFMGQRKPAAEVFRVTGLEPLQPFGKDALSILSSNAYSLGLGALTLHDTDRLLEKMDLIYAMSLEGLNGNVAPILWEVQKMRPFCGQWDVAKRVRKALEGSYLFQVDENRPLQDPLSFRTSTQVNGSVLDLVRILEKQLTISINSSDDNPAVVLKREQTEEATEQEKAYFVGEGAIIPSGNFEPITWVVKFEGLGIALSHAAHNSVLRMTHLVSPQMTGLSRFLAPDDQTIAYGTIQKAFMELDTEIRSLANPVSPDFFPVAGNIEDHSTNAPLVIRRLATIVEDLTYIAAMEEMHAAQALDLRKQKFPDLPLGEGTKQELQSFRSAVPFLDRDRVLSQDIEAAYRHLKEGAKGRALP